MKILVAGNGKVGSTLCKQLTGEGHSLTIIDSNPAVLSASMDRYDVIPISGNCASLDVLRSAHIETQDLLIAATGNDVENMMCCLTAHKLNEHLHTIARIRDPQYMEQAYLLQEDFGLTMAINPEKQAAMEIAGILRYPGFLKRETLAKSHIQIVEMQVEEGSMLCDAPLKSLPYLVKCRVLVCAVLRNGESVAPDGRFVLKTGDRLFVTAPSDVLPTLMKNLGITTRKVKRAMIVGGGDIGYYLAEMLVKTGINVTIIEQNSARCNQLAALLPNKVSIICGDGSRREILENERINTCDALISLTDMDELNMAISLFGDTCNIPQIVTKLSREDSSKLLSRLPIGSVICPRRLCSDSIVSYVRAMQNQQGGALSMHSIADGQAAVIEFAVDEFTLHREEALKTIKFKKNILVVAITTQGTSVIPNGDSCFHLGDNIVVVAGGDVTIQNINDIFA